METVRIGCSGWVYPHWRGRVYPEGLPQRRWLAHYATLFDTVEVNATFYRLPRRETVAAWVEGTPPGFVFAVKASRYLTHVKRLRDLGRGLERFYACIEPLADSPKLGPVLWQLRRISAVTTSGSPERSRGSRPGATASSFVTRAGSSPTSTRSSASTGRRSSSATRPRGPSRRTS